MSATANIIQETLEYAGFERIHNGGGTHVWIKDMGVWTVSVCSGQADEPKDGDTRIHVNAHWSTDCEKFVPGIWVTPEGLLDAVRAFEAMVPCLANNQEPV